VQDWVWLLELKESDTIDVNLELESFFVFLHMLVVFSLLIFYLKLLQDVLKMEFVIVKVVLPISVEI